MATTIQFSGVRGDSVAVREDAETVEALMRGEGGRPVALEHASDGRRVYVNPGRVAYWYGEPSPSEP